jgi:hypothetical protein
MVLELLQLTMLLLELKHFRDSLIIFCEDQIFRLIGSSAADFKIELVTRNIGCTDGFSLQEIGGDILFLAPDGLRTSCWYCQN